MVQPVIDGVEAVVVSVFGTDTVGLGPELADADAEASSMLTFWFHAVQHSRWRVRSRDYC